MRGTGTPRKERTPAERFAKALDSLEDAVMFILFLLCFLVGLYSLYDSYLVYQKANDTSVLKFKPGYETEQEDEREIKGNMVAWVEVKGTTIDYPVMQGASNTEYLNTDPYGDYSLSGSIFLDYRNSANLSDDYLLIYGHHMDANAMFGGLDHYCEETFFNAHPKGTLVLEHTAYDIDLFAAISADAFDEIIFDPTGSAENTEPLLDFIRKQALQYREPELPANARILGLSTCSDASTNARIIVFGILNDYTGAQ